MTAVPDWDIAGATDAELAGAAAGGDRSVFAEIYDRYADRLHDFCVGMLRDRDGTADCVQDTFLHRRDLPQLRDRRHGLRPFRGSHLRSRRHGTAVTVPRTLLVPTTTAPR